MASCLYCFCVSPWSAARIMFCGWVGALTRTLLNILNAQSLFCVACARGECVACAFAPINRHHVCLEKRYTVAPSHLHFFTLHLYTVTPWHLHIGTFAHRCTSAPSLRYTFTSLHLHTATYFNPLHLRICALSRRNTFTSLTPGHRHTAALLHLESATPSHRRMPCWLKRSAPPGLRSRMPVPPSPRLLGKSERGPLALVTIRREGGRTPPPKHVRRMSDALVSAGEKHQEMVEVELKLHHLQRHLSH